MEFEIFTLMNPTSMLILDIKLGDMRACFSTRVRIKKTKDDKLSSIRNEIFSMRRSTPS